MNTSVQMQNVTRENGITSAIHNTLSGTLNHDSIVLHT